MTTAPMGPRDFAQVTEVSTDTLRLLALRDELRSLVADWDGRLANTAKGERAHLLETLGVSGASDSGRLGAK